MEKKILIMKLLNKKYGVCRLDKGEVIPQWSQNSEIFSVTKTADELSILCEEEDISSDIKCERDWRVLKVEGPLDFSLVGILASISGILAQIKVSIFAISTYDTDYILVKNENIEKAVNALIKEGYEVNE